MKERPRGRGHGLTGCAAYNFVLSIMYSLALPLLQKSLRHCSLTRLAVQGQAPHMALLPLLVPLCCLPPLPLPLTSAASPYR